MLRVALCITGLEPGGAERCLAELAARVDRQRFRPTVCCLARRPRDTLLVERLEAAGVEARFFGAQRAWHAARTIARVAGWLAESRADVLQSFLFHANVVGPLAACRSGLAAVATGIRVAEPSRRWRHAVERWAARRAARHVCVSRDVAAFAAAVMGLSPDKLVVIPNGVDSARHAAAKPADLRSLGIAPGRKVAVFVGRLDRQKNPGLLIAAAAEWMARLPSWDLLVVGDGPLREPTVRQCGRLGIAHRVHLVGARRDVPELLAAASLLVLSSSWEGMPNAVLEAMAAGLPVVATRAEGLAELLGAAAEEQLVPLARGGSLPDATAVADRVVRIASDPATAGRLGRANWLRAAEFSLDRMVRAYETLWEGVADETATARRKRPSPCATSRDNPEQ